MTDENSERTACLAHVLYMAELGFELESDPRTFTLLLITVSPAPVMTFQSLSNITSQHIPQTLVNLDDLLVGEK